MTLSKNDLKQTINLTNHTVKKELTQFAQSLGITDDQLRERFIVEPALLYQALAMSIENFQGPQEKRFTTILTSLALHFYTEGMQDCIHIAEEYKRKPIVPKHLNLMQALNLTQLAEEHINERRNSRKSAEQSASPNNKTK